MNKGMFRIIVRIEITMVRVIIIALSLLWIGATPAYSQIFGSSETRDRGEPIFTPLKNFRDRAENGVITDKAKKVCDACKLKGKLFPEAACKRCQREKANEEDKAKGEAAEEAAEEAELKKLEAEAKKAELEAQLLEEEEKKRNKPWDIADEENAELGDLLAMAAEAKKDQDLAPKKQQALDYLASLGCSKDPRVTKAVMAGLKDFNVEVRKTAVQTVIFAVQGAAGLEYPQEESFGFDPYVTYGDGGCAGGCASGTCNAAGSRRKSRYCKICGPKTEPEDKDCPACDIAKQKQEAKAARKQQRDQRRKDRVCGCGSSSCGGGSEYAGMPCEIIGDEPCQACMGADGCKSCCDSKIREELRKMAFDPDPKRPGCYYEPSIEVRNLALTAYNLCPAQAKKDDPTPKPLDDGAVEGKGSAESEGTSEGEGTGSGVDDSIEPLSLDGSNENDGQNKQPSPDNDESESSDSGDADSDDATAARSRMLGGRITQFNQQGYSIRHSSQYHIPTGNLLYISTNTDDGHIVEVVNSNAGMAQVKFVDGRFTGRTSSIRIGVMR